MATQVAQTFAERYGALLRGLLTPRAYISVRRSTVRIAALFSAAQSSARRSDAHHFGASPEQAVAPYLVRRLAGLSHETLICLFYDHDGAFRFEQVHEGTPSTVAAVRCALTRAAVGHRARYVLIAHNHPAGEARPSEQDIETTRALHRLFTALGISLVDHAIVARGGGAFSFRQAGLI